MKLAFKISLILLLASCEYVTYSHHSRKEKLKVHPPIVLFDKIVEFRIEQNSWPISREDFVSKGQKYKEALADFQFMIMDFKVKDSNMMVLRYYNQVNDVEKYKQTQKIDLNSYQGTINFLKENNQFVWKKIQY